MLETDADAELKKIVRGVLADSDIPAIKKFLGMGTLTSTFLNQVGAAFGMPMRRGRFSPVSLRIQGPWSER